LSVRGCVKWHHPAGDIAANAGDAMLIRPQVPQWWFVPPGGGSLHTLWAIFFPRAHWLEWMQYPQVQPGYARITLRDKKLFRQACGALRRAHLLATSHRHRREDLALSAIEETLLWCREDQEQQGVALDPRVQEAVAFLTRHLAEPVTLDQVARASHASRARLAVVFRRQIGLPPMAFLERERMRRAKRLLQATPFKISQVAGEVGFADPRYFTQRFKRCTGQTPGAFRRQPRGPASDE
jgi:AraC-like DNA-binding protein